MDPASKQSAREAARETAEDAREGAKETGKEAGRAASEAAGNIQHDLQALRDDLAHLADELRDLVSGKGNAAWWRAKSSVDDMVSDAQAKGQEAMGAVREVSDNFLDAVDESLNKRPYATLALAVGLGFLLGATWRR